MNDMKISGAGIMGGGEFKNVSISGAGKVLGDISCESFKASGSSKVTGSVKCDGLAASGAAKITKNVECSGEVRTSGAAMIGGSLSANEIHSSGALYVGGDVTAESAHMSGGIKIKGLLNAERIEITFSEGSDLNIGQIGGGKLVIKYRGLSIGLFKHLSGGCGHVSSIEADHVEIENISAETVRAIECVIGDGCVIDTVEYSGKLTVSETASVKTTVKL